MHEGVSRVVVAAICLAITILHDEHVQVLPGLDIGEGSCQETLNGSVLVVESLGPFSVQGAPPPLL